MYLPGPHTISIIELKRAVVKSELGEICIFLLTYKYGYLTYHAVNDNKKIVFNNRDIFLKLLFTLS